MNCFDRTAYFSMVLFMLWRLLDQSGEYVVYITMLSFDGE
jgi:hypothetical protein